MIELTVLLAVAVVTVVVVAVCLVVDCDLVVLLLAVERDETETLVERDVEVRHVEADAVNRTRLTRVSVLRVDHLWNIKILFYFIKTANHLNSIDLLNKLEKIFLEVFFRASTFWALLVSITLSSLPERGPSVSCPRV